MNKREFVLLLLLHFFTILPLCCFSQINISSANGMTVDSLLSNYFVGDGITISNATFNGQTVINSNQLGIFTNESVSYPNMPVALGFVIVTGNYFDAEQGNHNSIESSVASPNFNGDNISIALSNVLRSTGVEESMNDVASIKFDFQTSGDVVSFKYCFASEEYPGFVCSTFNDIFGFFISGPYDENGNPITSDSSFINQRNIALVPGKELPVSINTINNGVSAGSVEPCDLTNTQYFITNTNDNCKMNGYTTELETELVNIIPNKIYKLELAICDVGDASYNSAVYLTANSFSIAPPLVNSNSPLCIGDTLFLEAQENENASYFWTGPNGWTSNLRNPFIADVTLDMQGDYSCRVTVDGQTSDPMTTEVLIGHPYDTLIVDTICQGNNYLFNGFNIIKPDTGNHLDTLYLNSIYGCDSIVKLELTVNSPYDTLIVDTICYGNDYIENSFNFIKPNPGNYSETLYLNTINGCDSIVTLNLTVNPSISTTLYDKICVYEEYNKYGFELKDLTAGEYTFQQNLTTTNGCDSIVYLNLIVNPTYDITISEEICYGDSYNDNGFNFTKPEVGNYTETLYLNSVAGCDSIVTINLTVNPVYESSITHTICHGEDFTDNGFNIIQPEVGTLLEELHLNTINGCDSIINLQLYVRQNYETYITDTICYGIDYTDNGFNMTKPAVGNHSETLHLNSIYDCDSTVFLNLNVIMTYDELKIDGLDNVLVSSDLITGYYRYTCTQYDNLTKYKWNIENDEWYIYPNKNECLVLVKTPIKNNLSVSVENDCGVFYDSIEIHAEHVIFEEPEEKTISLFPNPAKDYINIQYKDIMTVNIYNSQGNLVLTNNYNYNNNVNIDLSKLESSIYIMEIITKDKTISKRIAVIK